MESVLRTELLDAMPKSTADACMRHGYCTGELIVRYVMKQLILPPDINEVTMQKEILTPPKVAPATLGCAWLEETQHRLNLCIKTKQIVHPRTIVAFLTDTMSGITHYYRTVGNVWDNLYAKHQMRDSNLTLERVFPCLRSFSSSSSYMKNKRRLLRLLQVLPARSSTPCMMSTSMPVREKSLQREKARLMARMASRNRVHLAMITGNQPGAHRDTIAPSIIQGSSQADVRSAAHLVMLPPSVVVQSSPRPRMLSGKNRCDPKMMRTGMTINENGRSMKRPKARKEKGKDLSPKGDQKARVRRDRSLQDLHSLHRLRETDPNPNPSQRHAPA